MQIGRKTEKQFNYRQQNAFCDEREVEASSSSEYLLKKLRNDFGV